MEKIEQQFSFGKVTMFLENAGYDVTETSIVEVNGLMIRRIQFGSAKALEDFFLENLIGLPGVSSKVIGNTLLFWSK